MILRHGELSAPVRQTCFCNTVQLSQQIHGSGSIADGLFIPYRDTAMKKCGGYIGPCSVSAVAADFYQDSGSLSSEFQTWCCVVTQVFREDVTESFSF